MAYRFTIIGGGSGALASALILGLTVALYASGEPSAGRTLGAQAAAFLLATIAGLPTSLVFARIAEHASGGLTWIVIVLMPLVNGALMGAALDSLTALVASAQNQQSR